MIRRPQFDLEPRTARLGRHRPRAWPARPERPGDRLPRAVPAGGSAEPRPAAAAGQERRRATPPGRPTPMSPRPGRPMKPSASQRAVDLSRALDNQARPIPPDQLDRRRQQGTGQTQSNRSNAPAPGAHPDGNPVAPSELGYFGGLFSEPAGLGLRRLQGRNRDLHQRAAADPADRASARLPDAVGVAALWRDAACRAARPATARPGRPIAARAAIGPYSTGSCGGIRRIAILPSGARDLIQEACLAPCDEARLGCARRPDRFPCLQDRVDTAPAGDPTSPISLSATGWMWS